jgi:membrane associated rhomboid family serine protease
MDMRTQFYNKRNVFKAKYHHNTVMHLIITCAVAYVLLQGLSVIMIVLSSSPKTVFAHLILPNIGLQPYSTFIQKPWVLFTYFWMHTSFLNMLSNMLWLYCFGSVIQSFVGYREIFPMFVLSSILSGIGYLAVSFFWTSLPDTILLTSLPGVMAFAVGAFVLVPKYRFYLTEHFSVPIWLVLILFLILNVVSVGNQNPLLILLGIAAISGAVYIWMLKSGFKPGVYLYRSGNKIQSLVTPGEEDRSRNAIKRSQILKISKHQVVERPSQDYIDSLLDKINQKGYKSLTDEEKETLVNASKSK